MGPHNTHGYSGYLVHPIYTEKMLTELFAQVKVGSPKDIPNVLVLYRYYILRKETFNYFTKCFNRENNN